MNLYFLRHGIAAERGTARFANDSDRPLTPKGKRKVRRIAKAMLALDLRFDLILSSPFVRARQTAQIVAQVLDARKRLDFSNTLTPEASARQLISLLAARRGHPDDVLLVGHEPYLSQLISLLLAGDSGLSLTMRKGGLCKLRLGALRHARCACLEWLLTPKQMLLMS
jgi:phosphohistidine phosphatase